MSVDQEVYHILTVSGFSADSFDEAVKATLAGAWENHHQEFKCFVSYEVLKFSGSVLHPEGPEDQPPAPTYRVTLAISAIHREHGHGHTVTATLTTL